MVVPPKINPMMARILAPLLRHYEDPNTVEIRINKPKRVVIDRRGFEKTEVEDNDLTQAAIINICKTLANQNGIKYSPEDTPKLSCVLPGGHRFECLVGPSAPKGPSLAIRCKHPFTPTWEQIGVNEKVHGYLSRQIKAKKNIIISGATNTGKTTALNMLLSELPDSARVISVEDTPELETDRFYDAPSLLAARNIENSSGQITWRQMYDHLTRITPDQIIFGEISTENAFAALAALNSGGTGFMCTIHAESPKQVIERKFDQNIAWSGDAMPRIPEFLGELVDVIVQIKRCPKGIRKVTDIFEPGNNRYVLKDSILKVDIVNLEGENSASDITNENVPKEIPLQTLSRKLIYQHEMECRKKLLNAELPMRKRANQIYGSDGAWRFFANPLIMDIEKKIQKKPERTGAR